MIIKRNKPVNRHSLKRFKERYDLEEIDRHFTNAILQRIVSGKARLLEERKGRKVYSTHYRKKRYVVVVNKDVDHIITFLPRDYKL